MDLVAVVDDPTRDGQTEYTGHTVAIVSGATEPLLKVTATVDGEDEFNLIRLSLVENLYYA